MQPFCWVVLIVSVLSIGCQREAGDARERAPASTAGDGVQANPTAATVLEGELQCPAGTRRVSALEAEGLRDWCEDGAGKRNGPWILWYSSGARQAQGSFRDGLVDGPWQAWWENGLLKAKGHFRQGEQVGDWQAFGPDGRPL